MDLEKRIQQLEHQIELIEQDLKVKPVHIKRETVLERFDHRLVIINLVLIFLNIIFLMK